MSRSKPRENTGAISTLTIVLIAIIIVGSIATVVLAIVFFRFWRPVVQGSGNLRTEERNFIDFTIVEAGWGFDMEITQSDSYSVSITADDNLFDYLEISKVGDTLTVGMSESVNGTLGAVITMPDLYRLGLSGGSSGTLRGFVSSHSFSADLSGGCRLGGDFTTSGDVQIALSGGSQSTELGGAANDLTVSCSGGSQLDLSDFTVHDVTVSLSGGSSAAVNLDGRLEGEASGGSHLTYFGSPTTVDVTLSDGSTLSP